ncbi:hypothetical protein BN946_scf185043.g46 [Trametes cinnabarina]|uniref:WKF domain-containing protein n=1 Tax=Pycnoporus cinnabarinus TaxID=5643 RepID=A0A060SHK9_PYCCI|nr:hypothetical protein BN946_scf185043.g46 [Trametes cinnabarina]
MSTDTVDTSSRKHRKDKMQPAPPSEAPAEGAKKPKKPKKAKADEPVVAEFHEQAAPIPKISLKEKCKKRKSAEDAVETGSDAEQHKKKQKKRKHEGHARASAEEPALAPVKSVAKPAEDEAVKGKRSKDRKRKKAEKDTEETNEPAAALGQESSAGGGADPTAQSDVRPANEGKDKKKDKKKRKKGAEEEDKAAEGAEASSKREKKRKRRTTSGFPDPTSDEALTEQVQKALHYAFTQFEEPGSWKFNKARQNWIIRHVWSEEAIPETYFPLVSRYLEGVQGGAREALIKSCREALNRALPLDKTVPAEEETFTNQSEEQTASPSKRTVKFADPEPTTTGRANNPADETKRRRASALLTVLTSSSS